jgi:hypothetical protein
LAGRDGERDYSHRSLADKLGVKPDIRVALDGIDDAQLRRDIVARGAELTSDSADILLLGVSEGEALARRISAAWPRVAPGGALWIVYPKGIRVITEAQVLAAGRAAGLLDVKVARFSDTHTALRFVSAR